MSKSQVQRPYGWGQDNGTIVRYVIAWHPPSTAVMIGVGPGTSRSFESGWYKTVYDEKGREAYIGGGPFATAEEALMGRISKGLPSDLYCPKCGELYNGRGGQRGLPITLSCPNGHEWSDPRGGINQ